MDLFYPCPCYLHHIAFDRLESHTPFPCPASQLIYIFLKFQCVLCILNFSVANTVIRKEAYFRINEISLMYKENNKEPRTVPSGTPDKTGAQSDFASFTTTRCCLFYNNSLLSVAQKRIYPFQCLPTYATAKQFALKELMRRGVKCFLKIKNECINLSSIVQDFSPIIYYSSQLSFTTVSFSKCMLSI